MSRGTCKSCGAVVPTTGEPSPWQGWFLSDETVDKLELALSANRYLVGWLKKNATRLVLCEDCQGRASVKVIDVDCPYCGAKSGQPCNEASVGAIKGYHATRTTAAWGRR